MSRKLWIPLILGAVLVGLPALAGEIVHFTNGTTMVIESHTVEDGSVVVDLGDGASMAFPEEQIDKIVDAEGEVARPRDAANQMTSRPEGAARSDSVMRGSVPPRHRRGKWRTTRELPNDENVGVDRNGMPVYKPFGSNPPKNKQGIALSGRRELFTSSGRGSAGGASTGPGGRQVIPTGKEGKRIERVSVSVKDTPPPPKKTEKTEKKK